jgi:hypothetical protein
MAHSPGPAFTSDQDKSIDRLKKLEAYFCESGIVDKDGKIAGPFGCKSFGQCKESHPFHFTEGQLHHVGKRYDLSCNDKPIRVMVVGQDAGYPKQISLEERYSSLIGEGTDYRFMGECQYKGRNPHMRGTTSLLRLALCGKLGRDYVGEHLKVDADTVHIFDCFSLVNFLLCSALKNNVEPRRGAARGYPTSVMYENCGKHFLAAWEILEPTLVIVQGPAQRNAIRKALKALKLEGVSLPDPPARAKYSWYAEDKVKIYGSEADLISFYHPSARGQKNYGNNECMPYLLNVIQPTMERARKKWCCEGGDGNDS